MSLRRPPPSSSGTPALSAGDRRLHAGLSLSAVAGGNLAIQSGDQLWKRVFQSPNSLSTVDNNGQHGSHRPGHRLPGSDAGHRAGRRESVVRRRRDFRRNLRVPSPNAHYRLRRARHLASAAHSAHHRWRELDAASAERHLTLAGAIWTRAAAAIWAPSVPNCAGPIGVSQLQYSLGRTIGNGVSVPAGGRFPRRGPRDFFAAGRQSGAGRQR